MKVLKLIFLFIFYCTCSFAQHEYDYWVFKHGKGFNFAQGSSQVDNNIHLPFTGNTSVSSVSNEQGELLFYTDGYDIYDNTGQLLEGGKSPIASYHADGITKVMILKLPGNNKKYLVLFHHYASGLENVLSLNNYNTTVLYYKVVDLENKLVLPESILIQEDVFAYNVLKPYPNDEIYLMVTSGHQFFADIYPVNSNGVGKSMKTFLDFQPNFVSPNGLYFSSNFIGNDHFEIYQFNPSTITLSKKFNYFETIEDGFFTGGCFSSNNQYYYVLVEYFKSKIETEKTELWSFNIQANSFDEFVQSKTVVRQFDHQISTFIAINPYNELMYYERNDTDKIYSVKAIYGADHCKLIDSAKTYYQSTEDLGEWIIPAIPTFAIQNLSQNGNYTPDFQLKCPGSKLEVLQQLNSEYHWSPSDYLDNSEIATPSLIIDKYLFTDTLNYNLKVTDSMGCIFYDSTSVFIQPRENVEIIGPSSICPGSDSIFYRLESEIPIKAISWFASGGSIVNNSQKDSILINWGNTNPDAFILANTTNDSGCINPADSLKVNIFKELQTETPVGDRILSCGDQKNIYHVLPKHGSVFDWQIIGGEIINGYGSHQVEVQWDNNTTFGYLWINESVNTELEVCYGISDTLKAANPEKFNESNIQLLSVSNILNDTIHLSFHYNLKYPDYYKENINLQYLNGNSWENLAALDASFNDVKTAVKDKDTRTYDFRIYAENLCNQPAISDIHQNIVLTCKQSNQENIIETHWNPYNGWTNVAGYDIFHQNDLQNYEVLDRTILNEYLAPILNEGYQHHLYVKAYNKDSLYALSNTCKLTYDFPLWAPNVITPNGDEANQHFIIKNLEKHPENELIIYDRWGNLIIHLNNYQNNWQGNDLSPGTYYYHLKTFKYRHEIKGPLQIIK